MTGQATSRSGRPTLQVRGLSVHAGSTTLVHEVSFDIGTGERVGLIGESGSGKSVTALAVLGLLPEGLTATGSVRLGGATRGRNPVRPRDSQDGRDSADSRDHNAAQELLSLSERQWATIRGRRAAMVFQEPMTALNPTMRIGAQVAEVLRIHGTRSAGTRSATRRATLALLDQVGLPDPEHLAHSYPHQLSGGQRQRVVIAIALANDPDLLICDEPSTALDVTVQALVLDLIVRGAEQRDAGMLFITHDLAVVAGVCQRVLVMHQGRIVEHGGVAEVFTDPQHDYTRHLLAAARLEAEEG